jgi:hypothetical protein
MQSAPFVFKSLGCLGAQGQRNRIQSSLAVIEQGNC